MAAYKHIDRVCAVVLALTLVLTFLFIGGEALGIQASSREAGYEARLFDTGRVHTVDLVMDDWEGFLETCENEEYQLCSLVIDGEAVRGAGIRAKGNTSLTSVAAYGNNRYSFKIEFDHYDGSGSYYGLDKLSLNNLIQDNTFMKDFLVYQLMGRFGVAAPLCSYVFLTVNGEPWGLYLAAEGVEDGFLQRNYGGDAGQLYKPDTASFGGGRGNGGGFDMEELMDRSDRGGEGPAGAGGWDRQERQRGGAFGGMGSSDVKLQYIDDDPDSYGNIFDNAKTSVTQADKERLIAALQTLGSGENVESAVDVEQVIRYFVVHGFVCNGDSYTGSMVHNYYLYEKDGRLAMIPWDYNLAFGGFQSFDTSGAVNEPVDDPVSGGNLEDRPMAVWIFRSEEYTALYHQYYDEFLSSCLESGLCEDLIDTTAAMIAPYVEEDPTKFCTYEDFETGVEALKTFCRLRTQSVRGQLEGEIPSTIQGQAEDGSALVDCSGLNLSDMGNMGMGGGFGKGGFPQNNTPPENSGGGDVPAFAPGGGGFLPGQNGFSPGQDGFSPVQDGDSPGRDGFSPGQDGFFPGQEGFSPGQDGFAPPGGDGRFPSGDLKNAPGQDGAPGGAPASSGSGVLGLAVSGVVLAAGLGFAVLFRRRR